MDPDRKKLRIFMTSDDFCPAATGVGTHLQCIAPGLVERGHRVAVLTTIRPGEPTLENWEGVRVYRSRSVRTFGFYQSLAPEATIHRLMAENDTQIVHHHYLSLQLMRAERAARRLGLPQVYTYHMDAAHLTQPWPLRPLKPLASRLIVNYTNRFDLVIAPSLNLVKRIKAGGTRTDSRYISNPVVFGDTDGVQPAVRPGTFMVFFAGRLNAEKNIPLLLRGFAQLLQSHQGAWLWIAGKGDQRARLESQCAALGIGHRVSFLGFLDHALLAAHYAACDVFVLPSLVETQGLVAMEAMRFSKPVIVTAAIVSAEELVEHGVNGYIVDAYAPGELAARLSSLADDPALQSRMGLAGLRRCSAFVPEKVVSALEDSYYEVLERRKTVA